jgi:hypothetical protein
VNISSGFRGPHVHLHSLLSTTTVGTTTIIGPFTEEFESTLVLENASVLSSVVAMCNFLAGPEATLRTLRDYVDVWSIAVAMVARINISGRHRLLSVRHLFIQSSGGYRVHGVGQTRCEG